MQPMKLADVKPIAHYDPMKQSFCIGWAGPDLPEPKLERHDVLLPGTYRQVCDLVPEKRSYVVGYAGTLPDGTKIESLDVLHSHEVPEERYRTPQMWTVLYSRLLAFRRACEEHAPGQIGFESPALPAA